MAIQEGKKIIKKYRMGSYQWNARDVYYFLTTDYNYFFELNGFECELCSSVNSDSLGKYSTLYLTDSFPKWFSCSYTMSLIDSEGTECLTTKGKIRSKARKRNILMTVYEKYIQDLLSPSGYFSLHISFDVEDSGVSEQGAYVEPDNKVVDQSVQTEEFKCLPSKDKSVLKTDIKVIDKSVQTKESKSLPSKETSILKTGMSSFLIFILISYFMYFFIFEKKEVCNTPLIDK